MHARGSESGFRRVPVGTESGRWEQQGSIAPFTRPFMLRHTRVPSLMHLVERAELRGGERSLDEILASPEWDRFVREATPFDGWEDMRDAAEREQTQRELLKGI